MPEHLYLAAAQDPGVEIVGVEAPRRESAQQKRGENRL
jgi:hypothetical protein